MDYISLEDIEDKLLKKLITATDIQKSTEYINDLAKSLGVTSIVKPVPQKIKDLAIAYSCANRAKYESGNSPKSFQGTDGADAYELKRRVYLKEVQALTDELSINPRIFTGEQISSSFYPTIEICRG